MLYIYICIYNRENEIDNRHRERGCSDFTKVKCKFSFPVGANGKESACQCRRRRRHELDLWVEKVSLEKEMATVFSILAWKIPWTEESGRLHRVTKSWV